MIFRMLWIGYYFLPLDGLRKAPTTVSLFICESVRYRMTVYLERGYNRKEHPVVLKQH